MSSYYNKFKDGPNDKKKKNTRVYNRATGKHQKKAHDLSKDKKVGKGIIARRRKQKLDKAIRGQ